MASIKGRVDEANKFMENGHKFMKTSLLKWTPDNDNAANQYQQAAMAYKGAGLHQKAIEANELAIKCYMTSQSSSYYAAKCMEQAALSSKEIGDWQAVSKYYLRAIDVYRTGGQIDTAIATMDRAAKTLTEKMPTMAADLYIQASESCAIEDRYRQAAEFCNRAATLYIKSKEYQRAANILREEINCYAQAGDTRTFSKTAIGMILLHIADKDVVAASNVLKTCQIDDDVYHLAQNLVTGYEKNDPKLLNSTLSQSYFRNLDVEIAKIARDLLNTYGKVVETTRSTVNTNANQSPEDEIPDQDENELL